MKNIITTIILLSFIAISCLSPAYAEIQYFSSFDGAKIAFTDEGQGQPVMLLHGFISDGSSWNKTQLKKMLLAKGYRVIIPDLRGNGHSAKPHREEAYRDDAEVKDLLSLAEHLHLDRYDAIGYSRGSIVLAKLLTRTQAITRAVIGGMGLDFTNPTWHRRIMFQQAFAGEIPITDETAGAVEYAKSLGADLTILSLLQKYQPVTSIAELQKINIPVLVIAGTEDQENGAPDALSAVLTHSQLKLVPGNHNETYKTTPFAEEVIHFLREK